MNQSLAMAPVSSDAASERVRPVLMLSLLWMVGGMGVAAFTARWATESGVMARWMLGNPWFWVVNLVIWLAISFFFVTLVRRVPAPVGMLLFALYAAWTGMSLSLTLAQYTPASVMQALVATTVLFATMAVFALTTRINLLKYTFYIFAAVIALLIISLLNWFIFRSATFDWWLSLIGVALFSFSTANGVQQIVHMDRVSDPALRMRLSIVGAMILFTNFINMFIRILRLMGQRR